MTEINWDQFPLPHSGTPIKLYLIHPRVPDVTLWTISIEGQLESQLSGGKFIWVTSGRKRQDFDDHGPVLILEGEFADLWQLLDHKCLQSDHSVRFHCPLSQFPNEWFQASFAWDEGKKWNRFTVGHDRVIDYMAEQFTEAGHEPRKFSRNTAEKLGRDYASTSSDEIYHLCMSCAPAIVQSAVLGAGYFAPQKDQDTVTAWSVQTGVKVQSAAMESRRKMADKGRAEARAECKDEMDALKHQIIDFRNENNFLHETESTSRQRELACLEFLQAAMPSLQAAMRALQVDE